MTTDAKNASALSVEEQKLTDVLSEAIVLIIQHVREDVINCRKSDGSFRWPLLRDYTRTVFAQNLSEAANRAVEAYKNNGERK